MANGKRKNASGAEDSKGGERANTALAIQENWGCVVVTCDGRTRVESTEDIAPFANGLPTLHTVV